MTRAMARFPFVCGRGIDTPEVAPASTPPAPFPLQSLSKLSIPTTKLLNFGQCAHFSSGGEASSSTTASPRSIIFSEYSSLNHSTCTSPRSCKTTEVTTQLPVTADSFIAKHHEQTRTSFNRTGYIPLSQTGRSTDRNRLSRWMEDSLESNVTSWTSPSSVNSASVVARPTVMNGDVSERSKLIKLSPGSKELLKFMYECL